MLLAITALMAIAACSSGDDEADATTPPATEAPATTAPEPEAPAAEIVKIGLLTPQTGPLAVYSAGFEDAAAVAIAELNDSQSDFE